MQNRSHCYFCLLDKVWPGYDRADTWFPEINLIELQIVSRRAIKCDMNCVYRLVDRQSQGLGYLPKGCSAWIFSCRSCWTMILFRLRFPSLAELSRASDMEALITFWRFATRRRIEGMCKIVFMPTTVLLYRKPKPVELLGSVNSNSFWELIFSFSADIISWQVLGLELEWTGWEGQFWCVSSDHWAENSCHCIFKYLFIVYSIDNPMRCSIMVNYHACENSVLLGACHGTY